jgi:hypothetical protein
MRSWEFWIERTLAGPDPWGGGERTERTRNDVMLQDIIRGPLTSHSDVEVAVALARFASEEFEGRAVLGCSRSTKVVEPGTR